MYDIATYTKLKARELNVKVEPSSNPKKKIDVHKNNKKIASVGVIGYSDYPTYLNTDWKEYADKKIRLYKERHSKDHKTIETNEYNANKLLL